MPEYPNVNDDEYDLWWKAAKNFESYVNTGSAVPVPVYGQNEVQPLLKNMVANSALMVS